MRVVIRFLATYAQKREDKTDPADLGRVKQWMNAPASKAAISVVYADKEPEKKG